ncbi:unnamed protein product [Agarophyton chilense]|eukprot:gb/GEZJ01000251.1/.p1 GENE.gb/GEZJ01000251.1/~~gb/GEZJ01000251.1/.p1  ORF type:complete len:620 (+),score=96.53 gb/GEZJ01000251.1/:3347-5206(+)
MPSAGPSSNDTPEAQMRFYEKAIKRHNDPLAMVNLADLLFSAKQKELHIPRAVQLLQRAIKQHKDPTAMNNLALHYLRDGDNQQRRLVIPLLERSLRIEEDSIVLRNLSDAVKDSRCGKPDPEIAIQLCERALRFGDDPKCIEVLAYNLLTLKGIKTQRRRAVKLFEKAIHLSNDASVMNCLGVCYVDGTYHLPASSTRAAKWFEKAIKAGNLPDAKCNLAYLLAGNNLPPSKRDPVRAVRLLEEAIQQVQSEVCLRTLAKIYRDVEQVSNLPRAIHLMETSLREHGTSFSRNFLLDIFLGFKSAPADYARALRFCRDDYDRTDHIASFRVLVCIMWSGAVDVKANPPFAVELMKARSCEQLPEEASALRYESETEDDVLKLVEQLSGSFFFGTKLLIWAILLSELESESSLRHAEVLFRTFMNDEEAKVMFAWLPLSLRVCRFTLPFHGDRKCMTYAMKRATHCYEASLLNLSSFLLEKGCDSSDEKPETVKLLEEAMDTGLRVPAMLNLGYMLLTGVGGVPMNRGRAIDLFEICIEETDNACARALLANALVDGEKCAEEVIRKSLGLWQSVEEEYKDDEEEVSRMRWMISDRAKDVWATLNGGDCSQFMASGRLSV